MANSLSKAYSAFKSLLQPVLGSAKRRSGSSHAGPKSTDIAAPYRDVFSADAVNLLPMKSYEGPIHLVRTQAELAKALSHLSRQKVLGFDTESRPVFKKGVTSHTSLVQLASAQGVWLVQLNAVPFDKELAALLANPKIIKAGVAIGDDMRALARLYPFAPAGLADLSTMARHLHLKTLGLRTLAANLLGIRISKRAQCSNWAREELEPRQIVYAATDAWLGLEIYNKLRALGAPATLR